VATGNPRIPQKRPGRLLPRRITAAISISCVVARSFRSRAAAEIPLPLFIVAGSARCISVTPEIPWRPAEARCPPVAADRLAYAQRSGWVLRRDYARHAASGTNRGNTGAEGCGGARGAPGRAARRSNKIISDACGRHFEFAGAIRLRGRRCQEVCIAGMSGMFPSVGVGTGESAHNRLRFPGGLNSGKSAVQTCFRSCPPGGKWFIPVGVRRAVFHGGGQADPTGRRVPPVHRSASGPFSHRTTSNPHDPASSDRGGGALRLNRDATGGRRTARVLEKART
jgi:hypothetical protein